jgi:hypothetical protein
MQGVMKKIIFLLSKIGYINVIPSGNHWDFDYRVSVDPMLPR